MENPYKSLIQPMLQTKALDVFNQMQQQPKGLLGGTQTPLQAGLLGAAQALSPYMGYTTMPTGFGQAATAALGGFGTGLQQQRENQLTKSLAELSALGDVGDLFGVGKTGTDSRTATIKDYEYYMSLDDEGKKQFMQQKKLDPDLMRAISSAETAGTQGVEGMPLSPFQIEFDKTAAPILTKFFTEQFPSIQENLVKINSAINTLKTQDVSGPVTGAIPKALQVFINPEAVNIQDDISSLTYQTLRDTLGPQFTEAEGKRMVEQAFNPLLDEKVNLKRLERQSDRIIKLAESKIDAYNYSQKNQTLRGYEGFVGAIGNKEDLKQSFFDGIFDESDYDGLSKEQIVSIYNDPSTSIYEKQFIESLAEQD